MNSTSRIPIELNATGAGGARQDAPRSPLDRDGYFVDAQEERNFRRDEWPTLGTRLRNVALWGGLAYVASGVSDWIVLRESPWLWLLLALRAGVGALAAALVYQLRPTGRNNSTRAVSGLLLACVAAGFSVFMVVITAYGDRAGASYHAISMFLLLMALYVYVPTLHRSLLWFGVLFSVIFWVLIRWVLTTPALVSDEVGILLIFTVVAGWQIAVRSNSAQRLAWQSRQRLREAQRRLQQIFEVCPVPLILTRRSDGAVLEFNAALQRLMDPAGRVADPHAARTLAFYANPQDRAAITQQVAHGGQVGPLDVRLKTTDGREFDVMYSAALVGADNSEILASVVEITEHKKLARELQRLTVTDSLTGVLNRRGFFSRAEALCAAGRSPPALLLMDVDHFKRYNDTHGHGVGDLVLQQLATRIRAALREQDLTARVGGEEFAALLPATPLHEATQLAERLRGTVADAAVHCHGLELAASVSIGVAVVEPGEATIDAALRRADAAMYRAKQGGRNRVEVGTAGGTPVAG